MGDLAALRPSKEPAGDFAYVTLVTNDPYFPGVKALSNSLRFSGTNADFVVLVTPGVTDACVNALVDLGARVVSCPALPLSEGFKERHGRGAVHEKAPFTKGGKPSFHSPLDNFSKLQLWRLSEYKKCVFLDADTIVLRNIDRLFAYPEFSAAPNVYESIADFHRLNSGVFVAKPDDATFARMMDRLDVPDVFWRRTDQTFLETYFADWHGLPVFFNTLQYVWFNLPALWQWRSVHVIHYQYEKPWEKENPRAEALQPLIDLWRAYFEGVIPPDIDALSDPVVT